LIYQGARLKFQQGDLSVAQDQTDRALNKFRSPGDEWHWRFLALKAEILVWRGQSQDAMALLGDAPPPSLNASDIQIRRKIVLGYANCFLQRYDEARKLFGEATQLAEQAQPGLLDEVANAQGTLSILVGDYPSAEAYFLRASQLARRSGQEFIEASALGGMGLANMREERYGPAMEWLQQSLDLSETLDLRTTTAKTLGNLGWCYFKIGDYVNARNLLLQAEDRSVEYGLAKDQSIWLTNLGDLSAAEGDYSTAEVHYEKSLMLARRLGNQSMAVTALQNLAYNALEEGRYDAADQFNLEIRALKLDRTDEIYSTDIAGRVATGRRQFPEAETAFRLVIAGSSDDTGLQCAAEAHLAELYAIEKRPALAQQQFRQAIKTIERARALLAHEEFRLSFLSNAIGFYQDYVDFLIDQHQPREALRIAELSRAQTLKESLPANRTRTDNVARNLNPQIIARLSKATILFYWLGKNHSWVWVITPRHVDLFPLPPSKQVDALVHSYTRSLFGPQSILDSSSRNGIILYQLLVGPSEPFISKNSRVIVLPDGSLYSLNFESLLVPAPEPHFWIEDVTVSEINSLALLADETMKPPSHLRRLLLIGNPIPANNHLPALTQAEAEMDEVQKYFAPSERVVLAHEQATPSAYLQADPEQFSIIHFVAHATSSATAPLESAVILSRNDGLYQLYARDIMTIPLRADLVTISSCEGAGERTYSGEGLVGLAWAFLHAGARDVIASLWDVNEDSTPLLMETLYKQISRGEDVSSALRTAKLSLVHSHSVYRHPFYWAAFVLNGA
jgi:CHAT domain-containing protein/Flp pilus assembly protein TadD